MPASTHPGVDFQCDYEPLYAATDGVVRFAGFDNYYRPYHVDLEPTTGPFRGERHVYGHMWRLGAGVVTGAFVRQGQLLGISGEQTIRGTTDQPDGTGVHCHWERRGAGGCALNPEPVLTAPHGDTPESPAFAIDDAIRVSEGPLNLRSGPGRRFPALTILEAGATLCVSGGLAIGDGYTWYPVIAIGSDAAGFVAADYCVLGEAGGCRSAVTRFSPDDRIGVADGPLNLRAEPSLSGVIRASLPTGTSLCVLDHTKPISNAGYTWYPVRDEEGSDRFEGWVAGELCRLVAAGGCRA